MDKKPIDPESLAKLKSFLRETSRSRLETATKLEPVEVLDDQSAPIVLGHWMTLILVASRQIRITYKIHYASSTARLFAEKSYGAPSKQISIQQANDFMKEYCNLSAGLIKIILERNQVMAGISLPVTTLGFDEVYFTAPFGQFYFTDKWALSLKDHTVHCSVQVEVLDEIKITDTTTTDLNQGDVELF